MVIPTSDELRFRARSLNRGLFNAPTVRLRHYCEGIMVCMHQSGTRWLKYMLGLTLAKLYDLPPPAHLGDKSIVGTPKSPIYPQIPQFVYTHSIPHYLFRSRTPFRFLHFPKYLILVRDIRDVLVAYYERHKGEHNIDFSTYLRGDVRGKKYYNDIWWCIRFLNGWGPVVERHPERTAVLKFEDLKADPRGELARVCDYFDIKDVSPDLLDEVIAGASKEEMAKRPDPQWTGAKLKVVRMDSRPSEEWYTEEDRRFVAELCRRNLKYTFGYRY